MTKKTLVEVPEKANPAPVAEVLQPKQYYTTGMWKKVVPVYKCSTCGEFGGNEDDMKLHVLIHIPDEKEKVKVLKQLLKES